MREYSFGRHPRQFREYNIWAREVADCKVNCHWHAVFTVVNLLAHGFRIQREICLIAVKSRCSWIDIRYPTTMNNWNHVLSRSFLCQAFPACNLTSQNAMIESTTSKQINIIRFTRSTFKFYARNRVPKYIEKRPLAMLRSKIIYSPKECV